MRCQVKIELDAFIPSEFFPEVKFPIQSKFLGMLRSAETACSWNIENRRKIPVNVFETVSKSQCQLHSATCANVPRASPDMNF
jgi:hypothetical protein